MPLAFIVNASIEAKKEMNLIFSGRNVVSATRQITCFLHENEVCALQGNLHDSIDAPFCVEFDMRYTESGSVIMTQRIFN